jgi:glyoxylase-like metal-dependent hydrolase (beta-lactamase superfamily II)
MESLATGVYQISGYSRSFIIDGDEGVTLIDTGLPGRQAAIIEKLKSVGRSPKDVTAIVITHSHADHTGGAAVLKGETGALLYASPVDAPAVRGEEPAAMPPFLDKVPFLKPLFRLMPGADGVEVDHLISEEGATGLPEDLRVLETPGHTPGHVSLLLDRQGGVLFVGDAAVATKNGQIKRGHMNRSTPTFDASLRHIAEFDFEVACFGHSEALGTGAAAAFKRFGASLR